MACLLAIIYLENVGWSLELVQACFSGVENGERDRILRTPDNDCRGIDYLFFLAYSYLIFEILVCDKLENRLDTRWIVCFIPYLSVHFWLSYHVYGH